MHPLRGAAVAAWLLFFPLSAWADFADGLAAYDAGDYETAIAEWLPLAEQGDADAQVALAGLYLAGQGARQDTARAIRWYRRAAEAGNAVAQLNLGDFYSRGAGVPRDLVSAFVWLSLAAEQGRRWPAARLREVSREMTAAQLAEAEARLAAWRRSK